MNEHMDVTAFEATHENLKLVKTIGEGSWKIELFQDAMDGKYYAKGPFARWDSICYVYLQQLTNEESVRQWIKLMEDKS